MRRAHQKPQNIVHVLFSPEIYLFWWKGPFVLLGEASKTVMKANRNNRRNVEAVIPHSLC